MKTVNFIYVQDGMIGDVDTFDYSHLLSVSKIVTPFATAYKAILLEESFTIQI